MTIQLSTPVPLAVPSLPFPLSMYVHPQGDLHVSQRIRQEGIWEPYESSLALDLLQPGQVFVDVGANIGYFSLLAAAVVGSAGKVFAFEPDPSNFQLLEASVRLNKFEGIVQAHQAGLAAQSGDARLYLSEDNLGDHQIFTTGESRSSVHIALLNGSDFLAPRVSRIDLLKVDTQGSEFGVIEGLMPMLRQQSVPPRVLIELTPLSLRQCGTSGRQLIELLAELGQPFWIIDHIEHRTVACSDDELAQWCDDVDAVSGDEGFMNILVGPSPD
jgi:FkbM family methyltransferase